MKHFLLLLCMALLSAEARSDTSDDELRDAFLAVSAFTCVYLAEIGNVEADTQQLFRLGVLAARRHLEKVRQGKLTSYQRTMQVPSPWNQKDRGMSDDFVIGEVFHDVGEKTLREASVGTRERILAEDPTVPSKDVLSWFAAEQFRMRNCALLK